MVRSTQSIVLLLLTAGAGSAQTRVAHVIVALADNRYQGIVPVPAAIGNGDDPVRNLYWGAGYGLRTFLERSADWVKVGKCGAGKGPVLDRCLFRYRHADVLVVAEAYRGRDIKQAIADFLASSAGRGTEDADLVAYVGHDGLMDFRLDRYAYSADKKKRDAVVLACASKSYFADGLRWTGARPLLWTTGLMAPEAYVVEAALAGWARRETDGQIRARAAKAYHKYQHCGERAAMNLFATGW